MTFYVKSGRYFPEWVAGYFRNPRQPFSGISGRYRPEFAEPPKVLNPSASCDQDLSPVINIVRSIFFSYK